VMLLKALFVVLVAFTSTSSAQLEEAQEFYDVAKVIFEALGAIGVCEPPELSRDGGLDQLIRTTEQLKQRLNDYAQTCPLIGKYSMVMLYLVIRDKIMDMRSAYQTGHPDDGPAFASDPTHNFPDDYHAFNTGMCQQLLAVIAKQWDSCNSQNCEYVSTAFSSYSAHCSTADSFIDCEYEWQHCFFTYSPNTQGVTLAPAVQPNAACSWMSLCQAVAHNVVGNELFRDSRIWYNCDNGELATLDPGQGADQATGGDDSGAQADAFVQNNNNVHLKKALKKHIRNKKITKRK